MGVQWEDIQGFCPNCGACIRHKDLHVSRHVMRAYNKAMRAVADRELEALTKHGCYYKEGTDAVVPGSMVYGLHWWGMVRDAVMRRDGCACRRCGSRDRPEVHHIMFRSHGGSDHPYNLVTLCHACHVREHSGWRHATDAEDSKQRSLDVFCGNGQGADDAPPVAEGSDDGGRP